MTIRSMISRMASAASAASSGSASAAVRPSILRLRFLAYAGKIRAIFAPAATGRQRCAMVRPACRRRTAQRRLVGTHRSIAARRIAACREGSEPTLWPFASFALIREFDDRIELVNLGDCRILWKKRSSDEVQSFGSSRVTELDAGVVREIKRLHSEGITDNADIWKAIAPIIQTNRNSKNRPGGYWILDLTGEGLDHLQTMQIGPSDVDKVLLCTDGYYRLVDTYAKRTDKSLFDNSVGKGIANSIRSIREIERSDDRCLAFPRIKSSDDAT